MYVQGMLGSQEYDSIVQCMAVEEARSPNPGWTARLHNVWMKEFEEHKAVIAAGLDGGMPGQLIDPSAYPRSMDGFTRWLRATSLDLWEAGLLIHEVLFGEPIPEQPPPGMPNYERHIAIALKSLLGMGVPIDAFNNFST